MKCANCGARLRPRDHRCRRCGRAVQRPGEAVARKMTLSPRAAMACGTLLVIAAAVLLLYGAGEFAAVLLCLGAPLALIGLLMG